MGLDVMDHLRPIVISLNWGIGLANPKKAKMVMHLLEDILNKCFWDNYDFVFFAILSVYVLQ